VISIFSAPGSSWNEPETVMASPLHVVKDEPQNAILLVDDEPEICHLLAAMLKRAGYITITAHSIAEARKALLVERPVAAFIDIHLPDGLGYDLIDDIRLAVPTARVIAISAVDSESGAAHDRGADQFLAKPFDRNHVLAALAGPTDGPI
jgi:DNA-binding response OmpR family regulator